MTSVPLALLIAFTAPQIIGNKGHHSGLQCCSIEPLPGWNYISPASTSITGSGSAGKRGEVLDLLLPASARLCPDDHLRAVCDVGDRRWYGFYIELAAVKMRSLTLQRSGCFAAAPVSAPARVL
jgi:hypothetical protein